MELETLQQHWDALHALPRFRPRYPNEHVVRFLMTHFAVEERATCRILDIGVGGGRHTRLLCELGFQAFGVDISTEGLFQTERMLQEAGFSAELCRAEMTQLPFPDHWFHGAISAGVFCYADNEALPRAVAELHRVLRPDGVAFVILRSDRDYRYGKGDPLAPHTFRLTIEETNEYGLVQRFLPEEEVAPLFAAFREVRYELTETTFDARRKRNSDWLITVRK
ncbi:MAG: class I SAM-dependent methyltransferase [Chloroherpetonaceae bacterium]|nr:class I SAM-dependent methyltransferase [Chthonomonadaceae bacterium]MDW8206716.1 class I SAM-dependent methyltransferase [Chloroherpetonaceae bacterium]